MKINVVLILIVLIILFIVGYLINKRGKEKKYPPPDPAEKL